jgi:hypothetical protein
MRTKLLVLSAALTLSTAACHGGMDSPHGAHRTVPVPAAPVMTEAAIVMPIAPGKTEAWKAALQELTGPRYDEYETSRRRFGLTAQTTFLQRTPMGDLAVIHMTGPDVHDSFHRMSKSQDPWDVKWRDLTLDLHGVDFAKGERVLPHVEAAYSMDVGVSADSQELLFAAPLGEGGAAAMRTLSRQLMGERHDEYVRARKRLGLDREAVFLETTARGDVAVFDWRGSDPRASLLRLATSSEPFDAWMRDQAKSLHPVPLDMLAQIAGANTMVGQYPRAR